MSTINSRAFSDACTDARSFLNDVAGNVYSNTVLMPIAAHVYLEIQDEFANNGGEFDEKIVEAPLILYTPGNSTIDLDSSVTDFYQPIEIWERNDSASIWSPLLRVYELPAPLPTENQVLGAYEWSNQLIKVNPCQATRLLRMRYQLQLAYPTTATVTTFNGFYGALVMGIAAYGANAVPQPWTGPNLDPIYRKRLDDAIAREILNAQSVETPRRGWLNNRQYDNSGPPTQS